MDLQSGGLPPSKEWFLSGLIASSYRVEFGGQVVGVPGDEPTYTVDQTCDPSKVHCRVSLRDLQTKLTVKSLSVTSGQGCRVKQKPRLTCTFREAVSIVIVRTVLYSLPCDLRIAIQA